MTRAVDETCSATHTPVCTGVVLDGTEGTCTVAGDCVYTEQVIEVIETCAATAADVCSGVDIAGDYMFGLADMTGHEESCAAVARDACATADIIGDNTCTGTASDGVATCDLDPTTDGTSDCPAGCTYDAGTSSSRSECEGAPGVAGVAGSCDYTEEVLVVAESCLPASPCDTIDVDTVTAEADCRAAGGTALGTR